MSRPPSPSTLVDQRGRARREREVDFARGNVRHEGGILSDEIERLNARYLAGEFGSDELTVAIPSSKVLQIR